MLDCNYPDMFGIIEVAQINLEVHKGLAEIES